VPLCEDQHCLFHGWLHSLLPFQCHPCSVYRLKLPPNLSYVFLILFMLHLMTLAATDCTHSRFQISCICSPSYAVPKNLFSSRGTVWYLRTCRNSVVGSCQPPRNPSLGYHPVSAVRDCSLAPTRQICRPSSPSTVTGRALSWWQGVHLTWTIVLWCSSSMPALGPHLFWGACAS
jgi:hypothetical protein